MHSNEVLPELKINATKQILTIFIFYKYVPWLHPMKILRNIIHVQSFIVLRYEIKPQMKLSPKSLTQICWKS